ncbi:MAG: chromate transporter [Eubacteriales bacterium]|nr:chromate transporter [Eubacteriales bacterium]MDY2826477.1 chromate transporter [Eubacteriales bacterium]
MSRPKTLWQLFATLFKIGLFTFGGGYAMFPLLERELVEKKGWIEKEEFIDMVAIAESTPGPVAINTATFVGFRRAGIPGSLAATLGVCLPSFLIIYAVSLFFDRFLSLSLVAAAFRGIQVCVVFLVFWAGIKLFRILKPGFFNAVILFSVFACMTLFSLFSVRFSSIFYILIAGALGIFAFYLPSLFKKKNPRREEQDETSDENREEKP